MTQNAVGKKIETLCNQTKISFSTLAERSGLNENQVNNIISDKKIPSLGSLIKIARALGVRVGTFLDDTENTGAVVHRADTINEAASFSSQLSEHNANLDFYALAQQKAGRHTEPFIINIKPSAENEPTLSSHEGEEFIYVLNGNVKIIYGKDTYILNEGDSIYYDSIVEHLVDAADENVAKILAVVYTPF